MEGREVKRQVAETLAQLYQHTFGGRVLRLGPAYRGGHDEG